MPESGSGQPLGVQAQARHPLVPPCARARTAKRQDFRAVARRVRRYRLCGYSSLMYSAAPLHRDQFASVRNEPGVRDSPLERGEFELPVPICEQSEDSIRLSLRHRGELQSCSSCRAFLARFRVAESDRGKRACSFSGSLLRHQSRCRSSRTRGRSPSNVADRISRP